MIYQMLSFIPAAHTEIEHCMSNYTCDLLSWITNSVNQNHYELWEVTQWPHKSHEQ